MILNLKELKDFFLFRELSLLLGMSRHTPQTLSIFTQYKTTKILEQSQVSTLSCTPACFSQLRDLEIKLHGRWTN